MDLLEEQEELEVVEQDLILQMDQEHQVQQIQGEVEVDLILM